MSFAAVAKAQPADAGSYPAPVGGPPEALPTPVGGEGVTTVLFVDDAQLTPPEMARVAPALKKMVEVVGEQKGVLALVAPASGVQMADEAAGNRAVFWAAIDKIVGQRVDDHSPFPLSDHEAILADQGDNTALERLANRFVYLNRGVLRGYEIALAAARGRASEVAATARIRRAFFYEVLLKSFAFLALKPGRRSVVVVTGGYASDKEDLKRREVINRSLRANAPVHFLDARGVQGVSRFLDVQYREGSEHDGMEEPLAASDAAADTSGLAADTGGLYVRNANDMIKGLGRILEMTGTYYVLGYEPPPHAKGGFRKIKVDVATKGLKVLARRGYFDDAVAPR